MATRVDASHRKPLARPVGGSALLAGIPAMTAVARRLRHPSTGAPGDLLAAGYIPTLDGWRAVAIALVLVDHAFNATVCARGSVYWCNRVMVGQTGVNLFFAISGFLITSRLVAEYGETSAVSLRGFYIRRAFRILPAALLYLAVVTALALTRQIAVSPRELTGSLLFFRNYQGPQAGFYTTHFWSLAVEEQFYFVWPVVLIALVHARRRWIALVPVSLALVAAAWRQTELLHDLMRYGSLSAGFFLRTDVRADGLMLGAALALMPKEWHESMRKAPAWMWVGIAGAYVMVVSHFGLRPTIWESALAPMLIVWTVHHARALPGRVLESMPLRWLGRISYSLYVWQQLFFPPSTVATPWPHLQRWPLAIPSAVACAVVSYYLVERPSMRFGRRLAPPTPGGWRGAALVKPPAPDERFGWPARTLPDLGADRDRVA